MSIDNRNQLAGIVVRHREATQCRRCIRELSELSEYHHDPIVITAVQTVIDMLEESIVRLHQEIKREELRYLGPDPAEEALKDLFVKEEEE